MSELCAHGRLAHGFARLHCASACHSARSAWYRAAHTRRADAAWGGGGLVHARRGASDTAIVPHQMRSMLRAPAVIDASLDALVDPLMLELLARGVKSRDALERPIIRLRARTGYGSSENGPGRFRRLLLSSYCATRIRVLYLRNPDSVPPLPASWRVQGFAIVPRRFSSWPRGASRSRQSCCSSVRAFKPNWQSESSMPS